MPLSFAKCCLIKPASLEIIGFFLLHDYNADLTAYISALGAIEFRG